MTTPHAITSLTLQNFRNYTALSLELSAAPVVLRGANGAGKTNILEAISLLSPGRGLRGARLREMDRVAVTSRQSSVASKEEAFVMAASGATGAPLPAGEAGLLSEPKVRFSNPGEGDVMQADSRPHPDFLSAASQTLGNPTSPARRGGPAAPLSYPPQPWVVAAKITVRGETSHIGTGRDGESAAEKRIIKINGERVKSHAALAAHTSIQWLTPSMDQVFIEGGTARRKFFDRLVYGFAPEHAVRVTAYESSMRERNRLLTDRGRADPYWLSVLEQQMAEHAVAITLARQEALARLQAELVADIASFPRAELCLTGELEGWLIEGANALQAEQHFAERLAGLRGIDGSRGRATTGPHRSAWGVTHSEKRMAAEHCSTGEQKALILSILLAAARARANWCGVPPILLLDEVIAHLDEAKRAQLFALIRESRIQAWMTGTDAADFKGLDGYATVLEVEGGVVKT